MKLNIKLANGSEKTVDVDAKGLKLAAAPGTTYKAIDAKTSKTPTSAKVKREGDDLVIDGGDQDPGQVRLEGFFDECKPSDRCWAVLDTPAGSDAAAAGRGEVVITQDGYTLEGLAAGTSGGMTDGQMLAFGSGWDGTNVAAAVGGTAGAGLVFDWLSGLGAGTAAVATTALSTTGGGSPQLRVATGGGGGEEDTGGGGGGGDNSSPQSATPTPLVIKGYVAAGPMQTGTVEVSVYDKDGNLLGKSLVRTNQGEYEIDLPDLGGYSGPLLLVARDLDMSAANYLDEATGQMTNLGMSLAAVGVAAATDRVVIINITPLTQLAAQEMGLDVNDANAQMSPPADVAMIARVNSAVSAFFGVPDILGNVMTINDADFRTSDAAAQAYGVALARLSELDSRYGNVQATLTHLAQMLWMDGGTLRSSDASLNNLGTVRTVATLADRAAAEAEAAQDYHANVNRSQADDTYVVVTLPVNSVVGDLVKVRLTGANGSLDLVPHVVTAQDLARGWVALEPTLADLTTVGTGTVVPTAVVSDANGANASALQVLTPFFADVNVPVPTISFHHGENGMLNAQSTSVDLDVTYAGMIAGDVVQLEMNGQPVGQPIVVTAQHVLDGVLHFDLPRAVFGADGVDTLRAKVTDSVGNVGESAQALEVLLDTHVPVLNFSNGTASLTVGAGQVELGAGDPGVQLVDGQSDIADSGPMGAWVSRIDVKLAGFVNGAAEKLTIGGQTFNADGSHAPASVTVAGRTWTVGWDGHTYSFTVVGQPASEAEGVALMASRYNNLSSVIQDGQRTLTFEVVDEVGNVSNTVVANLMVATTAPALNPLITGLSNDTGLPGDFITTQPTQTVTGVYAGLPNAGDRIQVSVDGQNWIDATFTDATHWSAAGITLQSGAHNLYVRTTDLAGNVSTPTPHAYLLIGSGISTTATIVSATEGDVTHGSVQGSFDSGTSTDGHQPTLAGTLSASLGLLETVAVYDNAGGQPVFLGNATVSGTSWSFTTPTLATGSHSLVAVVENRASGTSGLPSAAFVVNEQSITLTVTDAFGPSRGVIADGGSTDDTQPTIGGTLGSAVLGAGEVVGVYDGNVRLGTATVNGNTWSFTPGTLGDGSYAFSARIEDGANPGANGRVVSATTNFAVDTASVAPTQTTTIDTVADDNGAGGSSTGPIADGGSTDDRTPTLSGTVSAGLGANEVVAVYDNTGGVPVRLGTATVNGTNWTFTTPTLPTGVHNLSVVVERPGTGLQGPATTFTVIEQAVAITAVTDDQLLHVSLGNNALTDDSTPTLTGTIGAPLGNGEVVAIYDGNTKLGEATVDGYEWTFTTPTLLDGVHALRVMVQDGATGNATNGRIVSAPFNVNVLTLLNAPATTATVNGIVDDNGTGGSFTGQLGSGQSTDDRTPTLNGSLSTPLGLEEVLAVYDGGVLVGYATVNGTSWSFTTPTLGDGSHSFTVQVVNGLTGLTGTASTPFVVVEQGMGTGTLTDDVGPLTGTIGAGGVTDDTTPTFSGTLASPTLGNGEVIAIYDGNTKIGEATLNGSTWTFTPNPPLGNGPHELRAVVQDGATGTAATGVAVSPTVAFTVDTSSLPPTQTATIGGITDDVSANGSATGSIAANTTTDDRTPTLNGTLSAGLVSGQAVVIYDGSTKLGTAIVNGSNWTFTTPALADGSHSLRAVVENVATGAQGPSSPSFQVIEQTLAMDDFAGLTGAVNIAVGGLLSLYLGPQQTLSGSLGTATLGNNEVVAIYDGNTKIGNAVVNGTTWSFTPTSNFGTGFHQITAVVQDANATGLANARVATPTQGFNIDLAVSLPLAVTTVLGISDDVSTNGSVTGMVGTTTDDSTPTVSGLVASLLVGAQVVAVYDGNVKLGNATVNGLGWTFTTPALSAGSHSITARVENPVTGQIGNLALPTVIKVQSLGALTVYDDIGTIQGNVANGGVTDDKRPTISGTLATADFDLLDVVAIYDTVNGVTTKLGVASVNGTNWTFTPLLPLVDGNHSFKAVVQNALALDSSGYVVSPSVAVTIDSSSTPLQTVTLMSLTDDTAQGGSKTGTIITLGSTDDATPTLKGVVSGALTGAQVVGVYDTVNGVKTRIGTATVDAGNPLAWTFTPGTDLVAGTHVLTARVENTATGTQGLESLGYTVVERPITVQALDNSGAIQGDVFGFENHVTNDTSLSLSGTIGTPLGLVGGLLEQVRVYDNGVYKGNATVNGTDWTFNLTGLSAGNHDLSVRISDVLGGYQSAAGGTFTVAANDLPGVTQDGSYSSTGNVNLMSLRGTGTTLDLTMVSGAAQPQLDVIDVGASNNTVKLALADVLQGSVNAFNAGSGWTGVSGVGKHQVLVDGSSGTVNLTDGSWSSQGTATHGGHTYTVYEDAAHTAQLLVETHLSRQGVI